MIRNVFPVTLTVLAVGLAAAPLGAQDNSLYILQDNSTGGMSNTLSVDQSAATLSEVGTAELPAEQLGSGNAAEISIVGLGSSVSLSQQSVDTNVDGNSVSLDLIGTGLIGAVLQNGSGNTGTLTVRGTGAAASLIQEGNANTGEVLVTGNGTSGTLRQVGDRNDTTLNVGGAGTNVTYNVIGNGLTNVVPPSVTSNGATVTVTQTGPGALR